MKGNPAASKEGPISCDWKQVFLSRLLLLNSLSYLKEGRQCLIPAPNQAG